MKIFTAIISLTILVASVARQHVVNRDNGEKSFTYEPTEEKLREETPTNLIFTSGKK